MSADLAVVYQGLDGLIPPSEYVVHNATDEPVVMQYDGETRTIPSFNSVLSKNKTYPDVPHSLQDAGGEYVKGTLIIRDVTEARDRGEGVTTLSWSAAACIAHCLGIDIRTQKAYGNLALKGVSFIPRNASKDQIAKIATEGRARYIRWMEENCATIVSDYEEANTNRAKNGQASIPPDKRVRIAQGVLIAARNRDGLQAKATLDEMEQIIAEAIPPAKDEEAELKKLARGLAQELRADQELVGDPEMLVQRLMANPAALGLLRTKYKMRKLKEAREDLPEADEGVDVDLTAGVASSHPLE